MADDKQKCPMCGTKLKMINGRMTCKDCGYYVRETSTDSTTGNSTYSTSPQTQINQQPQNLQSRPTIPTYSYQPAGSTPSSGSGRKSGSGSGGKIAAIVGVITAIVVAVTVGVLRSSLVNSLSSRPSPEPWKPSEAYASIAGNDSDDGSSSQSSVSINRFPTPQSSFFRQLSEIMFDKAFSDITQEEFASVTALEIDFDKYEIYYQVNYEDGIPLTFNSGINIDLADLRCYTGLEWISLIGKGLKSGDLVGLENLYAVYSKNTLEELVKIIPYPENILELSVEDSFFAKNLSGVEKFPNLQYITVEYYGLEDISALTELSGLRGLSLLECDRLTDFSPLMSMTDLEQLSIQSGQLKTIDFVKMMPNLIYLGVEGSQIPNIDAISSCPNLIGLYLVENYSVQDYSPIGDLVNLTDLTIFKSTHAPIPSLEKLTKLERASFKNLFDNELPLVTAASNINQLYLENNYDDANLKLLTDLPLVSLSMVDCSISGNHPLAFLAELPDLYYLDLTESYIFGNMEEVFGLPSLQYLYLQETTGVIDFEQLPYNDNLLILYMSGLDIKVDAWGQDRQKLKDHYDMFANFPNVEELYLADTGIDSLDFVTSMPNLQYLNIIQNYVTSLKPLEGLDSFQTVLCGDNSILEYVSEESGIYVDTETDYYSYKR